MCVKRTLIYPLPFVSESCHRCLKEKKRSISQKKQKLVTLEFI